MEKLLIALTSESKIKAAIGMLEEINATDLQSKKDPKKNTKKIPRVPDIADVGIMTPRIEASLFK